MFHHIIISDIMSNVYQNYKIHYIKAFFKFYSLLQLDGSGRFHVKGRIINYQIISFIYGINRNKGINSINYSFLKNNVPVLLFNNRL